MIKTSVTDTTGKTCLFTLVLRYRVQLFYFKAAHRQTAVMTFKKKKTVLTESSPAHKANLQECVLKHFSTRPWSFLLKKKKRGWGLKRCNKLSSNLATCAGLLIVGLDNNWHPLTHQPLRTDVWGGLKKCNCGVDKSIRRLKQLLCCRPNLKTTAVQLMKKLPPSCSNVILLMI